MTVDATQRSDDRPGAAPGPDTVAGEPVPPGGFGARASQVARRAVLAALALAALLLGALVVEHGRAQVRAEAATHVLVASQELAAEIERLDERLSLSARLAVVGGDAAWVARYEADLGAMAAALSRAHAVVDADAARRLQATSGRANDTLVDLERRAMAEAAAGRPADGLALMDGEAYRQARTALAAGTRELVQAIEAEAARRRADVATEAVHRAVAAYVLALAGFVGLWVWLDRHLRRADRAFDRQRAAMAAAARADRAKADILEGADVGTWEWRLADDDCSVNARAAAMVGWPLARLMPLTRAKWLALAHPQDRTAAQEAMAAHLRGETAQYTAEIRMRHWDGQWVWLLDRGRVSERDADGRPLRLAGTLTDITDRAAAEQLWQSRAELSGDWFWQTDVQHRFTLVAGNLEVGDGPEALVGKRRDELGWYEPPEGGWEAFHARMNRHEVLRGVLLHRRADALGGERWHEIDARPRYSYDGDFLGYEGVGRDATERRQVMLSLQESLSLIDALFQAIPIPVVMKDGEGRIVRVNRAYERFLRQPAHRLLGSRTADVVDRRSQEIHETEDHRLMAGGGAITREVQARLPDGRCPDVLLSKAAIAGVDGRPIGIVGTLVDISEQKAAARALLEAKEAAEAANRTKSAFLATMSHEIRTPMNGVIGMAELLLHADGVSPDHRQTIRTVHDSARSLMAILDDILDFSKIEAGRLELEQTDVELTPLVEGVCDTLAPVADARGVELQVFVEPGTTERVRGDPTRLRQVLNNLVANAIKFSGGRAGQAGQVRVDVRSRPPADGGATPQLVFEVRDNGIGMDEATLGRIFDPFTQAEVSTTRRFGGTGLGLAICRRLVEIMSGAIEVESAPERGSVFRVRLPLPASDAQPPGAGPSLAGLSCLLVPGHGLPLDDLTAWLRAAGATVHGCLDRTDARGAVSRVLAGLTDGAPVVVIQDDGTDPLDPLGEGSGADPDGRVRHLLVGRGRRSSARVVGPAVVQIDVLRHRAFLDAVALAAGRMSPSRVKPLPGEDATLGARVPPPSVQQARERGQLILVAEDDATNRAVIQRQLALLGYAAEVAEDGEAALQRWREGGHALVLTDLHMPRLDGYMLAEAVRRHEREQGLGRTPVIALTANALKGEAQRARTCGMDDYLTKPVPLSVLRATLNHWMPAPRRVGTGRGEGPTGIGSDGTAAADGWLTFVPIGRDPVPPTAAPPDVLSLPPGVVAVPTDPPSPARPGSEAPPTDFGDLAGRTSPGGAREDDVLNLQVLRDLVGDDAETLRELLADFLEVAHQQARELREAFRRGDAPQAAALAHKLKSASRSVGALVLGEVCASIEKVRATEDPGQAMRRIAWFDDAFAAACARIELALKGDLR